MLRCRVVGSREGHMLRVVARPWCDRVLTADLGWQRSGADSDTSELLRKRIDQVILRNSP